MPRNLIVWLALLAAPIGASGQETAPSEAPAPAAEPSPAADAEQPQAADPAPAEATSAQVKTLSGMSILGNEEAPKSLVIVPWKSSEIGNGLSVDDLVDDRARPVDKEVFLRELHYYELRSGKTD